MRKRVLILLGVIGLTLLGLAYAAFNKQDSDLFGFGPHIARTQTFYFDYPSFSAKITRHRLCDLERSQAEKMLEGLLKPGYRRQTFSSEVLHDPGGREVILSTTYIHHDPDEPSYTLWDSDRDEWIRLEVVKNLTSNSPEMLFANVFRRNAMNLPLSLTDDSEVNPR